MVYPVYIPLRKASRWVSQGGLSPCFILPEGYPRVGYSLFYSLSGWVIPCFIASQGVVFSPVSSPFGGVFLVPFLLPLVGSPWFMSLPGWVPPGL